MGEPDAPEAVPDVQRPAVMAAGPASTLLTGYLSYGIGATDTSLGIAPITDTKDYDGRGDDVDTFAIDVPVGAVADARLFFQWRIPSAALDQQPYDLGIRLGFCVPDGGVDCASVQTRTTNGGSQLGLIYETAPVTSWWNFGAAATPLEPAYDRTYSGTMPTGEVLTALRDYACGCLEQRLIPPSGTAKMFVSVFPINRQTWVTNIPYKVEAGFGVPYPYTFVAKGGATVSCPMRSASSPRTETQDETAAELAWWSEPGGAARPARFQGASSAGREPTATPVTAVQGRLHSVDVGG